MTPGCCISSSPHPPGTFPGPSAPYLPSTAASTCRFRRSTWSTSADICQMALSTSSRNTPASTTCSSPAQQACQQNTAASRPLSPRKCWTTSPNGYSLSDAGRYNPFNNTSGCLNSSIRQSTVVHGLHSDGFCPFLYPALKRMAWDTADCSLPKEVIIP